MEDYYDPFDPDNFWDEFQENDENYDNDIFQDFDEYYYYPDHPFYLK